MNRVKTLLSRWWNKYQRSRWENAHLRRQLSDERSRAHLERQENGIRDIHAGGGGVGF
jgi:hypothetical protein